jgi:hypothetical protein
MVRVVLGPAAYKAQGRAHEEDPKEIHAFLIGYFLDLAEEKLIIRNG